MKLYPTETYGIPFSLMVPATIDEYNSIHGSTSAILDNAVSQDVNHVILGKIRSALAERLVSLGASYDTKPNPKGGDPIIIKPDKAWFATAIRTVGWDAPTASRETQAIADAIGYDVSSTRSSGPSKADIATAEDLVVAIKAGKSTFARVKTNLEARNPGLVLESTGEGDDLTFTVEALAAGIAFERRRIERERKEMHKSVL